MVYKGHSRGKDDSSLDRVTPSGYTSRQILAFQEASERSVAECPEWVIASRVNGIFSKPDSRVSLEQLGFTEIKPVTNDELFYHVKPPQNWTKSTSGYWTNIRDEAGRIHITQFYKGAFYDRDAFVNINDPHKYFSLEFDPNSQESTGKLDAFEDALQATFGLEAKLFADKLNKEILKEVVRHVYVVGVQDAVKQAAGITRRTNYDECTQLQKFVWNYFDPLFYTADSDGDLTGITNLILSGFTDEAPYPRRQQGLTPTYRDVQKQKRELQELRAVAERTIAELDVIAQTGFDSSVSVDASHVLPSGMKIDNTGYIYGRLAIRDGQGVIVALDDRSKPSAQLRLTAVRSQDLAPQYTDMQTVEDLAKQHLTIKTDEEY